MIRVDLEPQHDRVSYGLDLLEHRVEGLVKPVQRLYIVATCFNEHWYVEPKLRSYVKGSTAQQQHFSARSTELIVGNYLILGLDDEEAIDCRVIEAVVHGFDIKKEIEIRKY
ncbi:MAG TPA: hypothetical protein VLJ21_05355 [Candidatus Binatia bacterium]|nr:hypothetical protein [Candidatus Binatia bacterium]